ncbi:MAG: hypothetical protein IJU78_00390 [Clostridia bacterium]|nr:hypothetical protein [Clostridia bacterium]
MFKVIGIGTNAADCYLDSGMMYPGGNAPNFAAYAIRLGYPASYLGVFGDDYLADFMRNRFTATGMEMSRCRSGHGTSVWCGVQIKNGECVITGHPDGSVRESCPIVLDDDDCEYLRGFSLIHTAAGSDIESQLPRIHALGVPLSYDFSFRLSDEYFRLVCPHIDCGLISCGDRPEAQALELAARMHALGCPLVVATLGDRGAICSADGVIYRQNAAQGAVRDTLGAGDAFIAAFSTSYYSRRGAVNEAELIRESMLAARSFAAEICMTDGAFGMGAPDPQPKTGC